MRAFAVALVLSALAATPVLALGNPASENCVKAGGTVEIVTQSGGGQVGLCHLPNGYIIEEWTLMKMQEAGLKVTG
jgi:putative hemolysin